MVSEPVGVCQFVLCMIISSSVWMSYEINTGISTKAVANWSMKILNDTNICSLHFTLFAMQIDVAVGDEWRALWVCRATRFTAHHLATYWIAVIPCFWSVTRQQKWSHRTCRVLTKHPGNVSYGTDQVLLTCGDRVAEQRRWCLVAVPKSRHKCWLVVNSVDRNNLSILASVSRLRQTNITKQGCQ